MKINSQSPQQPPQQVDGSQPAKHPDEVRKKKAPRPGAKGDTVALPEPVDAELDPRQAEQARRVQTIKEQVKSGKYKVDARDVAEKMIAASKTPPDQRPSSK
ncbi:MAG TPA: flagellar biosynthesis anti-sigma factor FlgM [Geomonas sp.]|nr:flagellar biosynthesis anti-sigma factor FlgM [Geomonas sp.]